MEQNNGEQDKVSDPTEPPPESGDGQEEDAASADDGQAPESPPSEQKPERGAEFGESTELTLERLEDIAGDAADTVKEILAFFPRIESPDISSRVEDRSIWVEIEGDPSGRLIGRRGQTIDAFQHLLSKIMSHRIRKRITIHVDAEGYKKRYHEKLIKLAHQTADYVAATGSARALEPMSPADRRLVHMALKERPEVITASEGKSLDRFVVIWPREED